MDHIEQDMIQIIQQHQEAFNICYVPDTKLIILHLSCLHNDPIRYYYHYFKIGKTETLGRKLSFSRTSNY